MRVLVCGGRNFADYAMVAAVLDKVHAQSPITLLIHGDCNNPDDPKFKGELTILGADQLAARWARRKAIPYLSHPADWDKFSGQAGPIRNGEMARQWRPKVVIAFPGDRGTNNMIKQARELGIEVIVTWDESAGEK